MKENTKWQDKMEGKIDKLTQIAQMNCEHRWKTVPIEPQLLNNGGVVSTCSRCKKQKYWHPSDAE